MRHRKAPSTGRTNSGHPDSRDVTDHPPPLPGTFLAHLPPADRDRLATIATTRRHAARTDLFHQGDPSRYVMILLSGWIKVTSVSREGQEALLALRGPGDIIGDLAAIDGGVRSGTVTTLTALQAYVIDGNQFVDLVVNQPRLALGLLRHLVRGLRQSDVKRLEYVSANSFARLAGLLANLADEHGRLTPEGIVIDLPLSQRELATAAAASREAVARAMRALRDRDIVRTGRRRILVVAPLVLRALSRSTSDDPPGS
ncbi:Crp/Fnr family transcriptional regulator [Micromonospora sp. NBC_01699]|uniref:Crp/Fnr family transcriptional regulator n=1 Tax=Micromonospora sp. NBC_01699 TaxID=2975984 RepID=UPI002E31205B|nr:Crp/Fnr family transcriptional regulator [Micromonospora sp. NBC_01699]